MESFVSYTTEEEIRKEKLKAQRLRKSQWWKRKCAEGVCYFCKKQISPKELTMDHVIPLVRGGKSIKGNVVPTCKECNNKKKYLLPFEWEEYLLRLNADPWS
jgi:5-methylcytosine-specific restriction endonuclease McrA